MDEQKNLPLPQKDLPLPELLLPAPSFWEKYHHIFRWLIPLTVFLILSGIGIVYVEKVYKNVTIPAPTIAPTTTPVLTPIQYSSTDIGSWKTYTNIKEQYTFKYPEDWEMIESVQNPDLSRENNPDSTIWLRISPRVKPCPSNVNPLADCEIAQTIVILSDNNLNDLSIEDYVDKNRSLGVKYTPIILHNVEGKKSSNVPGSFYSENVFIKKDRRIYNIYWNQSPGVQIAEKTFDQILSTFKFLDKSISITPSPTTQTSQSAPQVMCTMEAKLCPDGSSVGRSGPTCEFAPCPQ